MYDFAARLPSIIELVDIILVAVVLYWVMRLVRHTRAERMLWGLAVIVLLYFVSERMQLYTFHWILNKFLASIVILVIVVFQKDIRKALGEMGRLFTSRKNIETEFLADVCKAVTAMSVSHIGGLIVIERGIDLLDFIDTGVDIDAEASKELLLMIFNTSSPLHDGAVIIRGGRLARAGSILPLTSKELTKSMGTRHRAAIGLSEETDAVVIVVSEKTGEISLVVEETLEMGIEPTELLQRLHSVVEVEDIASKGIFRRHR
jgi:diadenylate cyclase